MPQNKEEAAQTKEAEKADKAVQNKAAETPAKEIDLDKLYEQSEVTSAQLTINNKKIYELFSKEFKCPDTVEAFNGKGYVDLVIEKDGTVSDAIVVKSLHPDVDKEFVKVLKMLPKFVPGKINGKAVRSKFRMPMTALAYE